MRDSSQCFLPETSKPVTGFVRAKIAGRGQPPRRRRAGLISLLLLLMPASSVAQNTPCDSNLRTNQQNPNSYRLRGDRCEGLYVEGESGSSSLLIASFTEVFEGYTAQNGQPLIIDWQVPANSPVRLRAYSLRHRLYYRMDTVRPMNETSFAWPIQILAALQISRSQIGLVGWTQLWIGNKNRDLYVPLRIAQQNHARRAKGLQLSIVPRLELKEARVSLELLNREAQPIETLKRDEKLKGEFYPVNRSFSIPIPPLTKSGIYRLSVGAVLARGGSATTEVWFSYEIP